MTVKIALIGPGAIGTTIAAALHKAGRTPVLCGRTARESLVLHEAGTAIHVPGPVLTDPAMADGPADIIFLAVKTTQIEASAPWLKALCGKNTITCVLQNGIEQIAQTSPFTAGGPVIPSVVWFPAQTQPDGSVWLRGKARLTMPDEPAARIVRDVLHGTLCAAELVPNFPSIAWRKLIQNAAAGLMVLTGRRSGMYQRADIAQLAEAYLRECLQIARAEGAVLPDSVVQDIVSGFQANPADMGTSILADRIADRPLEWRIRNEVILRRAEAHGIAAPISSILVPLLAAASDGPG